RLYSKWADKIICNTNLAKKIATEKYKINEDQIKVVYNAINLQVFKRQKLTISIRKQLNISDETLLGVTVARIAKEKNYLGLIEAMRKLKKQNKLKSNFHLIIGSSYDKKYFNELKIKIRNYELSNKISFLGVRKDIPEILGECDFMVLPSFHEGFPNVLMEAMAMKTFVIATPVGGVPELIDNGINGLLSKSSNSKDIALAIDKYFRMPQNQKEVVLKNALNKIQNYSREKIFSKIELIYRSVMESK
ncbi:MAG: glycosyltransferase family 4 protein, partial [Petrotogales bacterium]